MRFKLMAFIMLVGMISLKGFSFETTDLAENSNLEIVIKKDFKTVSDAVSNDFAEVMSFKTYKSSKFNTYLIDKENLLNENLYNQTKRAKKNFRANKTCQLSYRRARDSLRNCDYKVL